MRKVKEVKKTMTDTQQNLTKDRESEMMHWKNQKMKEEQERTNKFQKDQVQATHMRQINDAQDRLKIEM